MIRRGLDALYLGAGWLAGLFMLSIFILMMLLSVGRLISVNIPAGDDFVAWCMAASAFLGLAHTFKSGELIRVGLVIEKLHGTPKRSLEIISLIIGTGFTGFFAWHATVMTYQSWLFNDMAQGVLAVPLWIPQLGYCGGLIILTIAFVDELIHVGLGGEPRYEKPPATTAEEVVERAVQSGI